MSVRSGDATGLASKATPSVGTLLATMDPSSADLAGAALGWLLPDDDSLAELAQVELQEFLWYQLPKKWTVRTRELHETAFSLAELFAAAGLERFATVCRASETHQILDAWQDDDPGPAQRMMTRALAASGVDPPDTPFMQWGSIQGVAEFSASRSVSQALEQAIDAGELVPGGRGWKRVAARVTETSLTLPRLNLGGESMLATIGRERAELWASGYPPARQESLIRVLPLLDPVIDVPDEADACLMPLRWLLEHVGDGATLTQAGRLPTSLVVEADATFGWFDLFGLAVRTEADLPELATLDGLARRTRLIIKRGRKVSLSALGRKVLCDPGLLWHIVVSDMFSAGTYEGEGAALAGARLVNARRPLSRQNVETMVGAGLEGRWRTDAGKLLDEWSGLEATRDFGLLGGIFGWLQEEDDQQSSSWTLTPAGRQAILLGLQIQARAPRTGI